MGRRSRRSPRTPSGRRSTRCRGRTSRPRSPWAAGTYGAARARGAAKAHGFANGVAEAMVEPEPTMSPERLASPEHMVSVEPIASSEAIASPDATVLPEMPEHMVSPSPVWSPESSVAATHWDVAHGLSCYKADSGVEFRRNSNKKQLGRVNSPALTHPTRYARRGHAGPRSARCNSSYMPAMAAAAPTPAPAREALLHGALKLPTAATSRRLRRPHA